MTTTNRTPVAGTVATWTPTSVHHAIDTALAAAGLGDVWVTGTVVSLRAGPRFTGCELVDYADDHTTVTATLTVGMFARDATHIARTLRDAGTVLGDGLEVRLRGHLDANGRFGKIRLLAEEVDPRTTIGAAVAARDRLVAELQASGELAAQQRLVVPPTPSRVGLVSAPGGAGRADVVELLAGAVHPFTVVEEQAAMSGPTAPAAVARALRNLERRGVDLILVARGGGSRRDLSAWDAAVIVACHVPVWVAVGHATDRSVADFAANASFPTPSAAAAALVGRVADAHLAHEANERAKIDAAHLARARRSARIAMVVAVTAVVILLLAVL